MAKKKQVEVSQASSTSSKRTPPLCKCGKEAKLRTSTTDKNPQKKFYNCPNSLEEDEKKCRFFKWLNTEDGEDSEDEDSGKGETIQEILTEIKACKELLESTLDEAKKLKCNMFWGCMLLVILIGCVVIYN